MCIINENELWFGDCTYHKKVVWVADIRGMTYRQALCKIFTTTSHDIKNSPGLYGICGLPIVDMGQIVDNSILYKHFTKRWKKSKNDEFFCPLYLTMETYTFCSDYRLIVPHDPTSDDP